MQFATAASQTFKFYKMKKLSRDEMKKVIGGDQIVIPDDCAPCVTLRDCLPAYKCMQNADKCYTCHRD